MCPDDITCLQIIRIGGVIASIKYRPLIWQAIILRSFDKIHIVFKDENAVSVDRSLFENGKLAVVGPTRAF